MLILIWGEVGIIKIPHLSLMAIFPFPTYGVALVVQKNPTTLGLATGGRIFIFTMPAKPSRGEWKYYDSWLIGNLFFSIRGFAAHREKSNRYFSSDEDFLILSWAMYSWAL